MVLNCSCNHECNRCGCYDTHCVYCSI